jgi:hypothetical protein
LRICYPLGDKPLFECIAISIRDYDLSKRAASRNFSASKSKPLLSCSTSAGHRFFSDWARVFTGIGKGGYICFFAEHIQDVRVERTPFHDEFFYLITVRFRRYFFFKRGNERFGIVDDPAVLDQVRDWLCRNRVVTEFEQGF